MYDDQFRKAFKNSFNIFQIYVDIDITQYYNKYSDVERAAMQQHFRGHIELNDGKYVLCVAAHGDDSSPSPQQENFLSFFVATLMFKHFICWLNAFLPSQRSCCSNINHARLTL